MAAHRRQSEATDLSGASIAAQSALNKLAKLSSGDHLPDAHLLLQVAQQIVIAIAAEDVPAIARLVRQTARAHGGSSATGTTKAARARSALNVIVFQATTGGAPSETRRVLARTDPAFATVTLAAVQNGLHEIRGGRSSIGVLADLVAQCGAFGLGGVGRRDVHMKLGKWLAKKK